MVALNTQRNLKITALAGALLLLVGCQSDPWQELPAMAASEEETDLKTQLQRAQGERRGTGWSAKSRDIERRLGYSAD